MLMLIPIINVFMFDFHKDFYSLQPKVAETEIHAEEKMLCAQQELTGCSLFSYESK